MMGRTHKVGGLSAGTMTATALYLSGAPLIVAHPEVLPAVVLGGWLGGMMPDIDHPNSTIATAKVLGIPIFKPLAWLIHAVFGHRGATHTIWALVATWLPYVVIPTLLPPEYVLISVLVTLFGMGYAMGYWSHIVLDSLTPSGTPMLWPLQDIHLARIPTGKHEPAVRFVLIGLTVVVCYGMLFFFGNPLPILPHFAILP